MRIRRKEEGGEGCGKGNKHKKEEGFKSNKRVWREDTWKDRSNRYRKKEK